MRAPKPRFRNGLEKRGKNFVYFIRNNYTWLPKTDKNENIDASVFPTSETMNEKSETDNQVAHLVTNADLKSLRIRSLIKIVVGHLNINSIRN